MFLRLLGLGLVLFLSAPSYSYAIVVSTTTFNTTIGPEGLDVYDNVGVIINGSHRGTGTYLGDGWVLTAAHVGAGDITLGGVSYSPIDATVGSAFTKQLDNPDDSILAGAEQKSDLLMYKIAGTPILSTVSIGTAPIISDVVTMVGAGWNVEDLNNDNIPDKHYFDSDFNEVIEGGHAFSGYLKGSGHAKRWGQNYVSMVDQLLIHDDIFDTVSFVTTFSDSGTSITNEAQAVPGDSGGAVFNSAGELIGTIYVREFVNTAQLSGNHQEKILYGEKTWIADLSAYSSQISLIQAVPEPSTWGLAIIGIMGVVVLVKVNRREAVLGE